MKVLVNNNESITSSDSITDGEFRGEKVGNGFLRIGSERCSDGVGSLDGCMRVKGRGGGSGGGLVPIIARTTGWGGHFSLLDLSISDMKRLGAS